MSTVRLILPKNIVKKIRGIAKLSHSNQWEYAGCLDFKVNRYNEILFHEPIYDTSKSNRSVDIKVIEKVWPNNPITFHTHPTPLTEPVSGNKIVTLPSSADFRAYIQMFPKMQSNLIAELSGLYVIDIFDSAKDYKLPVPQSVDMVMNCFREGLYDYQFNHKDNLEYFSVPIDTWSMCISELNENLNRIFGISLSYYSYDEPIILTIDKKQYMLRSLESETDEIDFK